MDYYNARWYDPQLGRFIQADTVIANAYDAISYDRYAYVANNPINHTDPTGHCLDSSCPQETPVPPPPSSVESSLYVSPASTPILNSRNGAFSPTPVPVPVPYSLVAPPDYEHPLPNGEPPHPHVEGLPDDKWVWGKKPGMEPGYTNEEDPTGSVWSPHPEGESKNGTEGEDAHWHQRQPGDDRGNVFPPNPGWGRAGQRSGPGVYNPETGRYGSTIYQSSVDIQPPVIGIGVGYVIILFAIKIVVFPFNPVLSAAIPY